MFRRFRRRRRQPAPDPFHISDEMVFGEDYAKTGLLPDNFYWNPNYYTTKDTPQQRKKERQQEREDKHPLPGHYHNGHLLLNRTRISKGMPTLLRSSGLDELARERAIRFSKGHDCPDLTTADLCRSLGCGHVGEHVAYGPSILYMHSLFVSDPQYLETMVDSQYTHCGIGTAKSRKGVLYMVQLMWGPERVDPKRLDEY